ncbi:hypothetical protein JTL93_34220, partial [Pseudomonas aeruginosa]|nr:hypothetical protein [Pseudomonas aeruginosa]
ASAQISFNPATACNSTATNRLTLKQMSEIHLPEGETSTTEPIPEDRLFYLWGYTCLSRRLHSCITVPRHTSSAHSPAHRYRSAQHAVPNRASEN